MSTDWTSLKVVDLKEECRTRNLLVGGKKAELVARLEEFEASQVSRAPRRYAVDVRCASRSAPWHGQFLSALHEDRLFDM